MTHHTVPISSTVKWCVSCSILEQIDTWNLSNVKRKYTIFEFTKFSEVYSILQQPLKSRVGPQYSFLSNGPLTRYAKLWVTHTPGMPRTFSPPPRICNPVMHHGTYVTHVPGCMTGSLTRGFHWSRWRGKRSRHSRCMRNPSFYVSGKRPTALCDLQHSQMIARIAWLLGLLRGL